ncbi:MAG: helix-turn-helix transcriptional regulator [Gammaproteobacteria bacterium]
MQSTNVGNHGAILCMEFTTRKVLAQRVRMLRSAQGWSQEVLADLSGLNRSYIGAVERFEHNIGLDNIEKISVAFNVSVADLVNSAQTPRIAEILGQGNSAELKTITLPSAAHSADSAAAINRNTVMQLLRHCKANQCEPLFNYLRFRGVQVID